MRFMVIILVFIGLAVAFLTSPVDAENNAGKPLVAAELPDESVLYYRVDGSTDVFNSSGHLLSRTNASVAMIDTPQGKTPSNRVVNLPNGAFVDRDGDRAIVYKNLEYLKARQPRLTIVNEEEVDVPDLVGWLAQATDGSIADIDEFYAEWEVPAIPVVPQPAGSGDPVLFYFTGIHTFGTDHGIIQPVLQWNQGGLRNKWTIQSWYCGSHGGFTGEAFDCNVGDEIGGCMHQVEISGNCWWEITTSNLTNGGSSTLFIADDWVIDPSMACCVLEVGSSTPSLLVEELPGSCYFHDMHLAYEGNVVDVDWERHIDSGVLYSELWVDYDNTGVDDSWASILTFDRPDPPPPPDPPDADFMGSPVAGDASLTVQFTDLSENAYAWYWEFGDGETSHDQNPEHTYYEDGEYTVRLTVVGGGLVFDLEEKPNYILVIGEAPPPGYPVASFYGTPTSGEAPLAVTFVNTSTNWVESNWYFGDGATTSFTRNAVVYHTYENLGTYDVTLYALNYDGADMLVKPDYIDVDDPPPPSTSPPPTTTPVLGGGIVVLPTDVPTDPVDEFPSIGLVVGLVTFAILLLILKGKKNENHISK